MLRLHSARKRVPLGEVLTASALGAVVWSILTLFFSPRWLDFVTWRLVPEFSDWAVSVRRGALVAAQVKNPSVLIEDSLHGIVQYRLAVPGLGFLLGLDAWMVLGLAHVGSWILLSWLFLARGFTEPTRLESGPLRLERGTLAVVMGASSWFFVSNGWLGYFDSLLVLGMVVCVYSGRPWVITLVCALAPWIDERFFLAFPSLLILRWLRLAEDFSVRRGRDFLRSLALPVMVLVLQLLIRLSLTGQQASPEIGVYLRGNGLLAFLQLPELSRSQAILRVWHGAWEGLRVGWVVLGLGCVGLIRSGQRHRAGVFVGVVLATSAAGLFSANDLSRSFMLLSPAVPLAWGWAVEAGLLRQRWILLALVAVALFLPAKFVVTNFVGEIRPLWRELEIMRRTPPVPYGQFHLGWRLAYDPGVERNYAEALRWMGKAAGSGYAVAQLELGKLLLQEGTGFKDEAAAFRWIQAAAEQGDVEAEFARGMLHERGIGTEASRREAIAWYERAAHRSHAAAQYNLAVMTLQGANGSGGDLERAAAWMQLAAENGSPDARSAWPTLARGLDASGRSRVDSIVRSLRDSIRSRRR